MQVTRAEIRETLLPRPWNWVAASSHFRSARSGSTHTLQGSDTSRPSRCVEQRPLLRRPGSGGSARGRSVHLACGERSRSETRHAAARPVSVAPSTEAGRSLPTPGSAFRQAPLPAITPSPQRQLLRRDRHGGRYAPVRRVALVRDLASETPRWRDVGAFRRRPGGRGLVLAHSILAREPSTRYALGCRGGGFAAIKARTASLRLVQGSCGARAKTIHSIRATHGGDYGSLSHHAHTTRSRAGVLRWPRISPAGSCRTMLPIGKKSRPI